MQTPHHYHATQNCTCDCIIFKVGLFQVYCFNENIVMMHSFYSVMVIYIFIYIYISCHAACTDSLSLSLSLPLSLSLSPFVSIILAGLLDYILCPCRIVVNKF